jgi:hypothetical protein
VTDSKAHEIMSRWAHVRRMRRMVRHVGVRVGNGVWLTDCGRRMVDPDVMDGIPRWPGEEDCLRCNFESLPEATSA